MLLRLQPAVERAACNKAGASGKPLKGCIIRGCPVKADSRLYCARYRLCEEHQRKLEVRAAAMRPGSGMPGAARARLSPRTRGRTPPGRGAASAEAQHARRPKKQQQAGLT
jgi:hypothetical protein